MWVVYHLPPALLYGAGHCGSESRRQGDAGDGLVLGGPAGRVVDPIEEAGHVHTVQRLPCGAFRPRKWESQLKNFTRSVVPEECNSIRKEQKEGGRYLLRSHVME